jgi:hypothetical protein
MKSRPKFPAAWFPFLVGLALVLLPAIGFSQHQAKKLILKDGSYQLATKYEVKGDRVRYLSAERGEWEELPKDLVDWPATEKYEKERGTGVTSPEAQQLDKELEAELKAEEARSPSVAPGLNLPGEGGIFLFDNLMGQPQLVELQQNSGDINRNVAGNILRGAINPVASAKQNIELKGTRASVQAHILQPVIYINPTQDDANAAPAEKTQAQQPVDPQHFRIVRAQVKKDTRVVGNLKIAIYGKVSQEQKFVETKVEPVSGGWIKLTPVAEMQPGEYAVIEMLGKEGMNLYVWDFGVNPSAPPNPTAWKPVPPKKPLDPAKKPELEKRQ